MEFEYSFLAKYLAGNGSAEELSAIRVWANESGRNAAIWKEVIALRMKENFDRFNTPEEIDKALSAIQERVERKKFRLSFRHALRYAAAFLLVLGSAVGYAWYSQHQDKDYLSIIVEPNTDVKKIALQDGSEVWLRGGTVLRIPDNFSPENRSVSVNGEAFFSVKKDSLSPFVVKANDIYVKVLGTSFNLKTDDNSGNVETTLVSGHVVLMEDDEKNILDMQPGEKVLFNADDKTLQIERVDVNLQGLWRLNQYVLEDMTLEEITERIADAYQVRFNFSKKPSDKKKYRFVFHKEESIEEVCSNLEYIAPIRCRQDGEEIFVTYQK